MKTSYQIVKFSPEKLPRRGAWLKCETCRKEFYVFPSRIKTANPRFCSVKCYKKDGKNNPMWGKKHSIEVLEKLANHPNRYKFKTGKDNPNFVRYGKQNGFIGISFAWWRNYLRKEIGKCEICSFEDKRLLEVHHKDRNRSHNIRENLILLCPNCHALQHWLSKSGPYKWMR